MSTYLPRIGMGSVALAHSLNQPTSAAPPWRGCTRGSPALHLGTYGAVTPPCTIGRHRAPPPDTRQPRAGSCCCFRQHRTVDLWAHRPPSSMLHGSWCPSRSHMLALRTPVMCPTTAVTWRLPQHGRKGENLRAVGRSRRSRGASRVEHTGGALGPVHAFASKATTRHGYS